MLCWFDLFYLYIYIKQTYFSFLYRLVEKGGDVFFPVTMSCTKHHNTILEKSNKIEEEKHEKQGSISCLVFCLCSQCLETRSNFLKLLSWKYCLTNSFAKQKLSGAPATTGKLTVTCFCSANIFCAYRIYNITLNLPLLTTHTGDLTWHD